ncbi:MAG: hypothetical protein ABSG69_07950 [Candidatus Acidiferrum sp.]
MNVRLSRRTLSFLIAATLALAAHTAAAQAPPATKKSTGNVPPAIPVPNAPQSTHYPILLLAFGSSPTWDVRIGPKGPELFERQGYPPIILDPADISREVSADTWVYRAKDSAAGATLSVRLTREACSESTSATKYTFRAVVTHSLIGGLEGCARIGAELFPRMPNQSAQDDDDDKKDADKKKVPAIPPITNAKAPIAVAFLNPAGKIIVSRNGVKKIAAPAGSQLCLSHDGKRLLYTREDPKPSTLATIVLYEFDTGHSRDLVHGGVSEAFWSPDDSSIAYLNTAGQASLVWVFAPDAPDKAAAFALQNATVLQGWTDAHTVLATDAQNAYWLSADRPTVTVALRDIYGDNFQPKPSDALRINPVNPDVLLISAAYASAPAGTPSDSSGTAYGFFLYELRSKRRSLLSPPDQLARDGEWSRDGLQVFYTRRVSAAASTIFRIFWDGTSLRRYADGSDLVIGQ